MDTKELIEALNRLKVETGSLACMGCGHEHSCSIHGCAIIREAVKKLEIIDHCFMAVDDMKRLSTEQKWISVDERLPEKFHTVLCVDSYKGDRNVMLGYMDSDAWNGGVIGEITHWMPMPKPPKGDKVNE